MSRFLLYISIFILAALHTKAAGLYIDIKDKVSNELLAGAQITIDNNGKKLSATTNANGRIYFNNVTYPTQLSIRLIGYVKYSKQLQLSDVTAKDQDFSITIFLDKNVQLINEVVVTGQVTPVLASQSIYKVNTVSSTQLAQRGAISLNDVLNYEMNNFVSNDNLLGSSASIGGIGGQNVKILMNGIPINGRENGNIDLGQLNMNNIKRVEMIQGPMSVMYGSNALGGVINLITTTPQKKVGFGIRTYLESIGKYNFSGNLNYAKNKHQLQISAARNFFQGWTPKDSLDRFQIWKPKTQYTADVQYSLDLNKLKLSYFGSYLNEKITNKGVPIVNAYEGYAFDEYYRTNRMINSINGNLKLSSKEQFAFTNSYSNYHRTKNRFKKDLVTLDQIETKSTGDQDTSVFNTLNLRGTLSSTRIKKVEALVGYEYTYEIGKSFKLANEKQTMSDLGLFTSFLYKHKGFNIQPSMRVTFNNRFNPGYTPAIHSKLDLGHQTQLRGSYARGFRAPSLKELHLQFIDQNHTIIGNPDLQPEIGDHVELGLDRQVAINNGTLNLSLNGYYNSIRNMITLAVYNSQGILRVYENIEQYKNWVYNLQGKYKSNQLSLNTGVGYIFVQESGIVPQHQIFEATINGSYLFKSIKTSLNFNYKYNSKQPVLTIDEQFLYTSPIHIANMSLQRRFFNNSLLFQAGVKNLFNIQTATLSGAMSTQNPGHNGSAGMQVFPERSVFFDFNYSF